MIYILSIFKEPIEKNYLQIHIQHLYHPFKIAIADMYLHQEFIRWDTHIQRGYFNKINCTGNYVKIINED